MNELVLKFDCAADVDEYFRLMCTGERFDVVVHEEKIPFRVSAIGREDDTHPAPLYTVVMVEVV